MGALSDNSDNPEFFVSPTAAADRGVRAVE